MDSYSHEFSIQRNARIHSQFGKCITCGSTSNSESNAFSKVITFAIHRISTVAIEALQDKKLLIDDENAMLSILRNIHLMKSTISYLLQETHDDADINHNESCGTALFKLNEDAAEDDILYSMFCTNPYKQKDHEQDNREDDNKEQLIAEISRGLVGGITILTMMANNGFKMRNLILAEDKETLREMLEIVQMVNLLIT